MFILSKTLKIFILNLGISFGIFLFLPISVLAQEFSFFKSQEIIGLPSAVFTAVADFNKDGNLDLAIANGNQVSIALNNGQGLFSAPVNFPIGRDVFSLTIADFNNDGNLDLATANWGSSNISILLGDGNGLFSHFHDIPLIGLLEHGASPFSIKSGDFNNDGHIDLVEANDRERTISVMFGDSEGNFSLPHYFIVSFSGDIIRSAGGIRAVEVADFNKDGNLDIAPLSFDEGRVFIFLGDGFGNFPTTISFSAGTWPRSISIADLNKDNNPDLIIGGDFYKRILVLLGDGNGLFPTVRIFNNIGGLPLSMAIADFNQDTNLDLASPNYFNRSVDVIAGDGFGNLIGVINSFVTGANPRGASIGDFNKDGLPDLAVSNQGSGSISILINTSLLKINIDVKPGSYPNCVNLKSKGLVPVAILGSDDFNVKEINPATIKFAGAPVALKENEELFSVFEDINEDSILDLMLHFDTIKLLFNGTETSATLIGKLFNGRTIKGADTICFAKNLFN